MPSANPTSNQKRRLNRNTQDAFGFAAIWRAALICLARSLRARRRLFRLRWASTSPADIVTCLLWTRLVVGVAVVGVPPALFQRCIQRRLRAVPARPVEPLAGHLGRHVVLRDPALRSVVRIDVALAVAERLRA